MERGGVFFPQQTSMASNFEINCRDRGPNPIIIGSHIPEIIRMCPLNTDTQAKSLSSNDSS